MMSLIIAYIGKKGCVMAADKRRVAYFGDKDNIELLESQLYDGSITTDEELHEKAAQCNVSIKISDDATKISTVGDSVMGEVKNTSSFETKRRRIYGTTNGYQIIELLGSKITKRDVGDKAIILFGNKFSKTEAERLISQRWKSTQSLKYMGDIFVEILEEVSLKTPTLGNEFDVLIKQPPFDVKKAQQHIDVTIDRDIKVLNKFRVKLQEDLLEKSRVIELANKIINEGEIGKIISVDDNLLQVELNKNTQAFDYNWKKLASPGDKVVMFTESKDVKIGDKVVIANEVLCLDRNKTPLSCDIILCNL